MRATPGSRTSGRFRRGSLVGVAGEPAEVAGVVVVVEVEAATEVACARHGLRVRVKCCPLARQECLTTASKPRPARLAQLPAECTLRDRARHPLYARCVGPEVGVSTRGSDHRWRPVMCLLVQGGCERIMKHAQD